jgi:predicted amidohydrolase
MDELRVAGVQMPVSDDVGANVACILQAIDAARADEAQILSTPEGALSGYRPGFDRLEVVAALREVTDAAREAGIGLALGTCFEEADGGTYNQLRFSRANGEHIGTHCKILRCGTIGPSPTGEIDDYLTMPLRTFDLDGVVVGGLICNDLWANPTCTPQHDPHLSQQLAAQGARIVFHAVNGGRDGGEWSRQVNWPFHEANLRMRARAAGAWIVTVDSCWPLDVPCSSPSGVIGPDGEWAIRTRDSGPQFFAWTIRLR